MRKFLLFSLFTCAACSSTPNEIQNPWPGFPDEKITWRDDRGYIRSIKFANNQYDVIYWSDITKDLISFHAYRYQVILEIDKDVAEILDVENTKKSTVAVFKTEYWKYKLIEYYGGRKEWCRTQKTEYKYHLIISNLDEIK